MKFFPLCLWLGFLFLTSCSADSILGLTGGMCDLSDADVCFDFSDAVGNTEASAGCTALQTTFGASNKSFSALSSSNCPTANLVGSCAYTNVSETSGTARYYSDAFSAVTGAASCTTILNGTWTAAR